LQKTLANVKTAEYNVKFGFYKVLKGNKKTDKNRVSEALSSELTEGAL